MANSTFTNQQYTTPISLTTGVSGTLPIGNGGTGTATTFTAGSIVFAGAGGTYTQDNASLFWDDTNNRLGIGTATPNFQLVVEGNDAVARITRFENTTDQFSAAVLFERARGTQASPSNISNSDWMGKFQFRARVGGSMVNQNYLASVYNTTANYFGFYDSSLTEMARFDTTNGRLGIGTTPTEKLHVYNDTNGNTFMRIENRSTGTSARAGFGVFNGSGAGDFAFIILNGQNYNGVTGWNDRLSIQTGSTITNGMVWYAAAGGLQLSTSATDAKDLFVQETTGRVGIGVGTPTGALHLKAGTATASTAPLKFTTGTVNTSAEAGAMEYNNTFHLTNSDATRRHIVTAPNTTKVTAGAPYTNDGYIVVNIGGTDFKVMTTA